MIKFTETGLSTSILKAIENMGFEELTPIQEKIIPYLLDSENDIIGLAQTGTGKTAAFGLPVIEKTNPEIKSVQALILSPTRELCIQICKEMEMYATGTKDICIVPVYGGAAITHQIDALKKGCNIVVATPGRALDLINRKALKVSEIRWLILDEADEMLNMGFKEELDAILENTPAKKQTLLFSATMPREVQRIANQYLKNPVEISAGEKNKGAENVSHEFYMGMAKNRYEILKRIVDINPDIYSIVFCRTRQETKEVADKLMNDGYNADALHGDLSQAMRESVMRHFRAHHLQILVATDVAARGLDVIDLTHVINYNLPDEKEIYIHRSGRTGRAGKKGISMSIVHTREMNKIRELEKVTGKKFVNKQIPNGEEICGKQLYNLIDKMEHIEVDEERIGPFLESIYKKLAWLDREMLIKKFVSMEFNRFLDYYKDRGDLNVTEKSSIQERFQSSGKKKEFSRFFINVGTRDNLTVPRLIGLINDTTTRRNIEIGKIDLMKNFSFFEVESGFAELIMTSFKNTEYKGTPVVVEPSKPDFAPEKREKFAPERWEKKDKKKFNEGKGKKGGKKPDGKNFRKKNKPGKR
ncbi:MAG: DEAD/DEAH box helicase [Bacteroidales bacterium]|nr:DEAD/DEAH box helicase [Bacteroidales bacterium]MDD2323634.1 DEAD/DEAH box helicase [Bacteroidales bacterium]MDD3010002.1 DEAD/DEAH box helicase [Bacteroidales bacterium]MDD3960580.1 DEAD/DEAH box helicase [Bacteroidales bacterium]